VTEGSAVTSNPGTAVFAAPELLRAGSLSADSDVYSFGVVAWHLISMGSGLADLGDIQVTYQVQMGPVSDCNSRMADQ
jgi:serine/threonine protein kinase